MTDYELLRTCLDIARNAHAGQLDRQGQEYIFHPVMVALQCDTVYEKCAGILHDVIEDTTVTMEDLRAAGIPEEVLTAVDLLTHVPNPSDPEDYRNYVRRLKASGNAIAMKVKIADLNHNSDLSRDGGMRPRKYNDYIWALEYLTQ